MSLLNRFLNWGKVSPGAIQNEDVRARALGEIARAIFNFFISTLHIDYSYHIWLTFFFLIMPSKYQRVIVLA